MKTIGALGLLAFSLSCAVGICRLSAQTLYVPGGTSGVGTSANGNVGIGTSSPGSYLDVNGATAIRGQLRVYQEALVNNGRYLVDSPSLAVGDWQYGLNSASAVLRLLNTVDGGSISFRTKSGGILGDKLTIAGNGKVGIGTTSPDALLDITQTISLSGTSFIVQDGDASHNIPLSYSYKVGTTGAAVALGFNYGFDNSGTGAVRANTSRNGWALVLNDRDSITDGSLGIQEVSSTGVSAEYVTFASSGHVGIGTTAPTAELELASNGTATFRAGISNNAANTVAQVRSSLAVVAASSSAQSVNGAVAYDYYNAGTSPSWSGALLVYNGVDDPNTNYGLPQAKRGSLIFQNVSAGLIATNGGSIYLAPASQPQMVIKPGGNVGIGTMNPTTKLAVAGTVQAYEVVVNTSWSDYVFTPGYRLAPLSEVEQHIKGEGHLPGIPSAAEVAEHGVSVGEMQAKLLAKVEEMTLYMIELKKENDELRRTVEDLKRNSLH